MTERKDVITALLVFIKKCSSYNGYFDNLRTVDDLKEDTNIFTDLCLDSIDLCEVALQIENHFNITVDVNEFYERETLGNIADYIMSKLY